MGAMKTPSLATVGVSLWLVRAILSTVVTTAVAFDWEWLAALRRSPCVRTEVTWPTPSVRADVIHVSQKLRIDTGGLAGVAPRKGVLSSHLDVIGSMTVTMAQNSLSQAMNVIVHW